jgi:hypothetical protein
LIVDDFTNDDGHGEKCATFTMRYSQARFSAPGHQDCYWADGDRVRLRGAVGNSMLIGLFVPTVLEEPAAIIYDLLRNYAGVLADEIDDSLKPTSESFVRTGMCFRGFIDETKKLITEHIAEICRDAGLILYLKEGKFAVARNPIHLWEYYPANPPPVWRLEPTTCLRTQRHTLRPKEWEYQGVRVRYARNPAAESGDQYTRVCRCGAQDADGNDVEPYFEIESNWIWREQDARALARSYYQLVHVHVARLLEIEVSLRGLDIHLGFHRIEYSGDDLDGAIFYVTTIDKDYVAGTATVKGVRMQKRFYGGKWKADDAPTWDDSTPEQRKAGGYWVNDDGLIGDDVATSNWLEWTND